MAYLTPRTIAALLLLAPATQYGQSAPAPTRIPPESTVAQPNTAVVTQTAGEEDPEAVKLQEFEVTGSRIRTLGGEATAVPVFAISQVELERRGVSRLADIRWAIPQLAAAVGFNDNLQNSGTSRAQTVSTSFNLRGIGGNSTLVLVDGRRIARTGQEAPGGAGGREDFSIDGIPVSAIERIEILPQGAGAIYGSEAIAGVVNVILKKSYRGAELQVTYDNTFDSDVAQTTVSLTAGYRAGKLNTFITLSAEDQNAMKSGDRWWTATNDQRVFGSTSTNFLFGVAGGAGSLSSGSSPYLTTTPNLPGLTTNIVGIPSNSAGTTAANSAFTTTNVPGPFDAAPYQYQIDAARRLSLVFRADYDVADWANLYFEARASEFRNDSIGSPVQLSAQIPAGYPGNPFSGPVWLRKIFFDLPLPRTISKQQNQGLVAGVRGDFLEGWRYDASASFSRNIVSDNVLTGSSFNFTLLNAALNNPNPAARPLLAYDSSRVTDPNPAGTLLGLMPVNDHKDTSDTYQYLVVADGPVWKGWAGDIRAAVGAEAGSEKVKFWREQNISTATFLLTRPFQRDMTAAFAELSVPLLSKEQGLPLVHRVEVGGAIRATDYSDIGAATTPTYRAMYQPTSWLTFRASRAEGFKPVRLYDLQAPITNFTTNITATSTTRDPLRGDTLVPIGTYNFISGGNPALSPEESVSRNAGVVIDIPGRWFKGLSFSADYYELEYTDRSGSTNLQTLLNFFPERIFRNPLTPADQALGYKAGTILTSAQGVGYDASNINLAGVTTKGWDFRGSYYRSIGAGTLNLTAAMSDPNVTYTKATPAAVPSSTFGHQPRRLSGSVFWNQNAWEAGVAVNYQNRYYTGSLTQVPYPAYLEFNPQFSYDFGKDGRFSDGLSWWQWLLDESKVTVTVINALNKEPDIIAGSPRFAGDPRLRRYIITVAKRF
jgi:iron complex outermembrane recepter protein